MTDTDQKDVSLTANRPAASTNVAESIGLNAREVVDDTINAVLTYCADGLDAFDECVATSLGLKDEGLQGLLQGSSAVYDRLVERVEQVQGFERLALETCLHVPAGLIINQEPVADPANQADEATELALDAELQHMRQRIAAARSVGRQHKDELRALDEELATCGDVSALAAVAGSAAAGKENLEDDAAAIAAAALRLQPLLARAQQLRTLADGCGLHARTNKDATVLAEKEMVRRKAAMGGVVVEDLWRAQERMQL
ncbi:hypothetical protein WJX72_007440 [[Myrmecia] bisecta]|uniref:Uncharacterized protein n=1 Tax=[Myrmecia] bisecta TaxID=41462 RepID=A0AAW1PDC4_9CHLO